MEGVFMSEPLQKPKKTDREVVHLSKNKSKRCDICRSELSSMTEKLIHFKEIQRKIKYVAKLKNPA